MLQTNTSELLQCAQQQADQLEKQRLDANEKKVIVQHQFQCVREARREDYRRKQELANLDLKNATALRTARLRGTLEAVEKQKGIDQSQLDLALMAVRQKQDLQKCDDLRVLGEQEENARHTQERTEFAHQTLLQKMKVQLEADLEVIEAGKNQAKQNLIQMQNDIYAQIAPLQIQAQVAINTQAIEKWRQEQESLLRQNATQYAQVA